MSIKYFDTHATCNNYKDGDAPLLTLIQAKEDIRGEETFLNNVLFYMIEGWGEFKYDSFDEVALEEKSMLFFSIGSEIRYHFKAGSKCFMFILNDEVRLCENFHIESLLADRSKEENHNKKSLFTLKANAIIACCMNNLFKLAGDNFLCNGFLDIKRSELLYLLGAFFSGKELSLFFQTYTYTDATFVGKVMRLSREHNSVAGLAYATHYTVSGFEKKFKKSFGQTPAKWLREQKAKLIYKDICSGELNFKEIADKYNFASTSTFNDFYKQTFGETPGKTRKKTNKGRI